MTSERERRDFRDVAMVFQDYALYPHMTLRGNISLSLRVRHMPKPEIEKRVRRAVDVRGIGALLQRYPHQLSSGQRQRVAIGRAIVRNPRVFLVRRAAIEPGCPDARRDQAPAPGHCHYDDLRHTRTD
jgi:ABC-type sugar transport system ATPase subunit